MGRFPIHEQETVARFVRYLDIIGVDPSRYWFGPDAKRSTRPIPSIAFSHEQDERADTIVSLHLPFADEQPPLMTSLFKAFSYLVHLLGEPGASARFHRLDVHADDERLLKQLDIDPTRACRPAVEARASGSFLAPDGNGFTYFVVEDRGELVRLAHSDALAPVAWAFAADGDMQHTNLHGRIARTVSGGRREATR